jgi:hypothetical protein
MDKQGQVGLNVAKAVILVLLGLGVLAFVLVIVLSQFNSTSLVPLTTYSVANETGRINGNATLTTVGYQLAGALTSGFNSLTIVRAYNNTDATLITSGNWTIDSSGNILNATAANWKDVNFTYTYNAQSNAGKQANNVAGNVTNGTSGFFGNTGVWFNLLGVVIIVAIAALVLYFVGAFGGNKSSGSKGTMGGL